MFNLENWIKSKTKKKDLVCPECKRTYEEIGEKIGMITFHNKVNSVICNDCGNKYIKLGAIDINEKQRIRKELEDKIYDLNKSEKLTDIKTCDLQSIVDRLEKERDEYLRLQQEIKDSKPSDEDWEIEDYLVKQYGVYQDKDYLTHVSQIEYRFKDIGCEYFECGQGYCQEEVMVIVKIGKKFYNVTIWAEIGSAKQDRGDRLYWVERIEKVTYNEIAKPVFKDKVYYDYSIKMSKEQKVLLDGWLQENNIEVK